MSRRAFSISVDLSSLDRTIEGLSQAAQQAARPAAQAMAQVLYDEVKRNVSRINRKTGRLQSAIYQAYSKDNSEGGRHVYHISWNAKKAPHGHLVEWGHLQRYEITFDKKTGRFTTHKDRPLPAARLVAARPFVRPAMAQFERARQAGRERLLAELAEKGVIR